MWPIGSCPGNDFWAKVWFTIATCSAPARSCAVKSRPESSGVSVTITGGVADVRLTRPDKRNALDPAMFAALIAAGERLKGEAGVRAVVLSDAFRYAAVEEKDQDP